MGPRASRVLFSRLPLSSCGGIEGNGVVDPESLED